MNDLNREFFDNYTRHYRAMEVRERLPDDLERLKRDRLPRWLDEVPPSARILDAGCAQGHWLEAMRRVGYTHLTGVELSAELLATARARLPEWVCLEQADLREWLRRAPPESFDVIFFHDVLEHLPREDTIDVLRGFHRLLVLGGRLSVRVPNMACLISGFCMAIDFTHVTHFTEYSLLQVLEAAGFDAPKIRFEQQAPRLFWSWKQPQRAVFRLLNRLRWHLNNAVHRGFYILADFTYPKVFDPNLVVVAQK
jgi:2-polyprenyl-3-methyl-5-hydroxy-6-metoxy-1,4-benzoquinol methylase